MSQIQNRFRMTGFGSEKELDKRNDDDTTSKRSN